MGLLDGKVILITGAGNGLGRAHALAAARAGARVVVNDLGGARDGSGGGTTAADEVVAEIVGFGGEAMASYASVTDRVACDAMVEATVARWGRLDALVNNAGILRDGTFRKMTEEAWKLVLDVHLNGTWNVTRAAVEALCASGSGAIVNTTSYSGLIGNFGQSNYAAAKAGIYGFSRVLALELRRANVTVNCVAPIAKTRMTDDIAMVDADWTAEQVSPMVVFLCSELARGVTGKVFGVQGQRIHIYEVKVNDGVEKAGAELWTPEEIAARLGDITSFEAPTLPASSTPARPSGEHPVDVAFRRLPGAFLPDRAGDYGAVIHFAIQDGPGKTLRIGGGKAVVEDGLQGSPACTVKTDTETIVGLMNATVDPQKAFMKGKITADNMGVLMKFALIFRFDAPDTAAQTTQAAPAVAAPTEKRWPIGKRYDGGYAQVEPEQVDAYAKATNDTHVAYYGPEAVAPPMFHVRLLRGLMHEIATDPELGLDYLRLVHGEHDAIFHRPLNHWDLVQLRATLETVEEKSSGLVVGSRLYGFVDGVLALEARTVYFIRGTGGKSSKEARKDEPEPPPPSFSRVLKVGADQSYRYASASLDDNPIHTDPETARAAGLPDVILHGLCTMALAGRSVCEALTAGDPRFLRRLSVRFARPVFNGSTLTTIGWKTRTGANFIVRNQDGDVVISNGVAEVRR